MQELIQVEVNEQQEPVVSARELHRVLGVKKHFTDWWKQQQGYGFTENEDYTYAPRSEEVQNNGGVQIRQLDDYAMKLDMAKELALVSKTEKGKEVRKYFIQVEKDFNSPEKIMARALKIAEHQISVLRIENAEQQKQIEEQKPKVAFANAITASTNSILIRELARLISQNGVDMGEKKLYAWMRENGYVEKNSCKATQKAINLKVLELVERTNQDKEGNLHTNFTT